jgi:DMSO/TMAO reductase YedYZ molybdopterin-dependent catalytic subunit
MAKLPALENIALALLAACLAALAASAAAWEEPAAQAGSAVLLSVAGEVPHPLKLTAEEFAQLPRRTVRATDREGKEAEFEGVAVFEILQRSGLKLGNELRGPALAQYLLVQAADGYRAVFALPEIDPACTDRTILLADRRDGKPLAAQEGPLRIVVPGEKRHARWVRQVVALRIGRA